jgi:hypothetical protein
MKSTKLRIATAFFKSWLLPTAVLLVLFTTIAVLTQGHHPIVQRLYTIF